MKRKIGIVVFAHGSRHPQANQALLRFVAELRAVLDYPHIEPAFMELSKPLIPEAIQCLVAHGCHHIYGYALFLVPGAHLQQDIPLIFQRALQHHPDVTWSVSPAMLEDASLQALVAAHLRNILLSTNPPAQQ